MNKVWLILSFLIIASYPTMYVGSKDTVIITVKDKERVLDNHSRYLIFTKEEVFEDVDSLIFLKFNSSDIYGKLDVGHTYKVTVAGWRIPIISSYRNIINIEGEIINEKDIH